MNISIGMLAYNEASGIAATIDSVLDQSIFQSTDGSYSCDLVIVPNGCKDDTAGVAARALAEARAEGRIGSHAVEVSEIAEAGKERAWNHFVHGVSRRDADYLILIDADVRLEHEHVFRDLVACLESTPQAVIAAGKPVKHINLQRRKSVFDRISMGATSLRAGMPGVLAGCLYCGRADVLRSFRLPTALMGEDAFIRAMIVTHGFTRPDDPERIVRVPTARVIFEAYTKPSEIVRNKTRRMLELAINATLYARFWAEATPERPATVLTHEWHAQSPTWSEEYVASEFAKRGRRPVPSRFITSQFRQLRHHRWPKRIALLPVALATLPLNALAVVRANRAYRRGEGRKLWQKPSAGAVGAVEG